VFNGSVPLRGQDSRFKSAPENELRSDKQESNNPVLPGEKGPAVMRAQILLDRASFSPGEIDGAYGANLRIAIHGFQAAHPLEISDQVGTEMWGVLNRDAAPILVTYEISPGDVEGPFQTIPHDMMARARLPELGYQSAVELLGEKFHVSPKLLRRLNDGKDF